ncbi:MAG TPA: type II toxin-antitoxin system VapC family toxin [Caldilineaceae bacterium]|nr:type II toxin-antitoxin system VapC family toxin [Caldilineaceae bacterium]
MNLYLDTSALVKLYVREPGTTDLYRQVQASQLSATSWLTYVEFVAALTRATQFKSLSRRIAGRKLAQFQQGWRNLIQVEVTLVVIARAAALAWDHGLRDYDCLHLASALVWQETLAEPVIFATYDRELWALAAKVGLPNFPPALIESGQLDSLRKCEAG